MKFHWFVLLISYAVAQIKHCTGDCQQGDENAQMTTVMKLVLLDRERAHVLGQCPVLTKDVFDQPCVDGKAGDYSCNKVDLKAFVSFHSMGSKGEGNDIWGWTDPQTKKEYALMGCTDGTSFVDVSDPVQPKVLGFLPSHLNRNSVWRDIKVYKGFAFIISEANDHGMQVFNLERLRDVTTFKVFDADYRYDEFGSCHNIVINEDTGFAYGVGSRTCRGGPHIVDIEDPINPKFVGCFQDDGYTHDAQCVVYKGPDTDYQGHEICFLYNENSLTIIDVEDKDNIKQLSRVVYPGVAYSHQGWVTEDQTYLLLDDELDEMQGKNEGYTQTRLWDVSDLDNPKITLNYFSPEKSVDHNMYVVGDIVYQANYESGLRILDVSQVAQAQLSEVGFFDCRPEGTQIAFNGAWSVYPWFESGNVILSSIERGLFVLRFEGHANATKGR